MTWLTWRQHRSEMYTLGLLVAVIAAFLLAVGLQMHSLFPNGAGQCVGIDLTEACSTAIRRLNEEHGYASKMLNLFSLVPFLIGAFFGAPLVAREMEAGTWQFAWTQSVPRMRWLAVKLGALALVTALLAGAFSAVITWYRQPIDVLDGRFNADAFDVEGLAPAGYALFAFAVATAAGAVLRRSLPALAVALGAFLAVRVFVGGWLRPNYQEPQRLVEVVGAGDPADPGNPRMSTGTPTDWTIDTGYLDSSGRPLSLYDTFAMYSAAEKEGVKFSAYLHERGVQQWVEYQPAGRFWTFQLVESAIFVGLAAALLAFVVWRIKHRLF